MKVGQLTIPLLDMNLHLRNLSYKAVPFNTNRKEEEHPSRRMPLPANNLTSKSIDHTELEKAMKTNRESMNINWQESFIVGEFIIPLTQQESCLLHSVLLPSVVSTSSQPPSLPPTLVETACYQPMDLGDDEFLERFASVTVSNPSQTVRLELPQQVVTQKQWQRCVLAKVLTHRSTSLASFTQQMTRAWRLSGTVSISQQADNVFLAEFSNDNDALVVIEGGPWIMGSDLVAVRKISDFADLDSKEVSHLEITIQLHNLNPDLVTVEGAILVASKIGEVISAPWVALSGGKRCYKVKVHFPISQVILDEVEVTLVGIGIAKVQVVYERLRNYCTFCGHIQHTYPDCPLWRRVARLALDPRYSHRTELKQLNPQKIKPWVANSALIPQHTVTNSHNSNPITPPSTNRHQPHHPTDTRVPSFSPPAQCLSPTFFPTSPHPMHFDNTEDHLQPTSIPPPPLSSIETLPTDTNLLLTLSKKGSSKRARAGPKPSVDL